MIATALAVAFAVSLLPSLLPGGAVTGLLGPHGLDPAAHEALAGDLHAGWPLPLRSLAWISGAAVGDLGTSRVDGADVGDRVARACLRTVPIVGLAAGAAALAARRRRLRLDATTAGLAALGLLGFERLAGIEGLGGLMADSVVRRDLMVSWGAVLAVAVGAALLVALGGLRPDRWWPPRPSSGVMPGWAFWGAGIWLVAFPAAAAFAARLPLDDPHRIDPTSPGSWPGGGHLLGTDDLGRDVLARTVFGARVSLSLAVAAVVVALVVGVAWAWLAEAAAARLHGALRTWTAMLVSFPGPLAALALASFGGREARPMVLWLAASVVVPAVVSARRAIRERGLARPEGPGPTTGTARWIALHGGALAARMLAVVILVEAGLGLLRLATDTRLGWSVDLAGEMSRLRPASPALAGTAVVALLTAASLVVSSRALASIAETGPTTVGAARLAPAGSPG